MLLAPSSDTTGVASDGGAVTGLPLANTDAAQLLVSLPRLPL